MGQIWWCYRSSNLTLGASLSSHITELCITCENKIEKDKFGRKFIYKLNEWRKLNLGKNWLLVKMRMMYSEKRLLALKKFTKCTSFYWSKGCFNIQARINVFVSEESLFCFLGKEESKICSIYNFWYSCVLCKSKLSSSEGNIRKETTRHNWWRGQGKRLALGR